MAAGWQRAVLALVAATMGSVGLLHELRYPAMVVWTAYPDVPPERVERAVTERVEEAVAGTSGLHQATARSQLGGSLIRLDFGWNTNLDLALLDVREQLDRLGDALPDEAERPIVLRLDPSERPIMMLAMREGRSGSVLTASSDAPQDLVSLKTVAREVVSRRLEQLDGVARVRVTGGYDRSVDIRIDPARLSTHNISIDDVARAVSAANVSLPGGIIRRGPFQYAVEVSGEFRNVADIASTVVARIEGVPVRLQDVPRCGKASSSGAGSFVSTATKPCSCSSSVGRSRIRYGPPRKYAMPSSGSRRSLPRHASTSSSTRVSSSARPTAGWRRPGRRAACSPSRRASSSSSA